MTYVRIFRNRRVALLAACVANVFDEARLSAPSQCDSQMLDFGAWHEFQRFRHTLCAFVIQKFGNLEMSEFFWNMEISIIIQIWSTWKFELRA